MRLRIVGSDLPGRDFHDAGCNERTWTNVHVGIQRRREVVDLVPGDAQRAVFDIDVELRTGPDGRLEPRGVYVQGRPANASSICRGAPSMAPGISRCSDVSSCGSVGSMSSCCGVPTRLDTGSSSGSRWSTDEAARCAAPGTPSAWTGVSWRPDGVSAALGFPHNSPWRPDRGDPAANVTPRPMLR